MPLTAKLGNDTPEMEYLNTLISKWMPESSKRVAVDSHPRLSGIMDTINSTLAHGSATRLPSEFYDPHGRSIIETIGTEEWFSGYRESEEYRRVGIGGLVGDIVSRMTGSVERNGNDGLLEVGGKAGELGTGRGGEKAIKFAMSGCHDTTLAAVLASLGIFEEGERWPPYTSCVAVELFRRKEWKGPAIMSGRTSAGKEERGERMKSLDKGQSTGWGKGDSGGGFWSSLFGIAPGVGIAAKSGPLGILTSSDGPPTPSGIRRKTMDELTIKEKQKLEGYYVRIRYNDRPMTIPGCRIPGNHLEGDESFCTLVSSVNPFYVHLSIFEPLPSLFPITCFCTQQVITQSITPTSIPVFLHYPLPIIFHFTLHNKIPTN